MALVGLWLLHLHEVLLCGRLSERFILAAALGALV